MATYLVTNLTQNIKRLFFNSRIKFAKNLLRKINNKILIKVIRYPISHALPLVNLNFNRHLVRISFMWQHLTIKNLS